MSEECQVRKDAGEGCHLIGDMITFIWSEIKLHSSDHKHDQTHLITNHTIRITNTITVFWSEIWSDSSDHKHDQTHLITNHTIRITNTITVILSCIRSHQINCKYYHTNSISNIITLRDGLKRKNCCSFVYCPNEGHLFISAFLINKRSLFPPIIWT